VVAHVLEDGEVFGIRTKPEGRDQWKVRGEGIERPGDQAQGEPSSFRKVGCYVEEDLGGEVENVLGLTRAPSARFMSPLTRISWMMRGEAHNNFINCGRLRVKFDRKCWWCV
jgi:hypothetical protein